jgi:hypothetical protein
LIHGFPLAALGSACAYLRARSRSSQAEVLQVVRRVG